MTISSSNLTIIVRECGERTADVCVQLLKDIFPGTSICRVSASPFHATLRQSLEIGIAEGRDWTLCIDADVLVLPELITFLDEAATLPPHVFEAQALILDKLIPSRRPAGNHLYRTELIHQALQFIPSGDSLRPESDMILAMAVKGFPSHQSFQLVGLHDFEQAHRDVYLKAFLHGHKHRCLMHLFKPIWEELARNDDDYRMALAALADSLRHDDIPPISRSFRGQEVQAVIAKLNIQEKPRLYGVDSKYVQNALESYVSPLSQETRTKAGEIQAWIDAALSPSSVRQCEGPGPVFPLVGKLRRWYNWLDKARAAHK